MPETDVFLQDFMMGQVESHFFFFGYNFSVYLLPSSHPSVVSCKIYYAQELVNACVNETSVGAT